MPLSEQLIALIERVPVAFFQHWSYPLVLLFSFAEAAPFLGVFVPGQLVVAFAGFLAKMGHIELSLVFLFAFFGAFLGDAMAYELGRRWGKGFLLRHGKYVLFGEREYRQARSILHEHPVKAVLLGKFNNVTRAFGPFIAGSSEFSRSRFFALNAVASFVWSACFVLIGYIFGAGFEQASRYVGTFALGAIIVAVFIIIGYRRVQRFMLRHQHRFLRYPVSTVSVATVSVLVFALVADNVWRQGRLTSLDTMINAAIPSLHADWLITSALLLTALFHWLVILLFSVALCGLLIQLRRKRSAAILATSMIVGFLAEVALKVIFHRGRPLDALVLETTGSFPSGHATVAAVFFAFLFWAFRGEIVTAWRRRLFIAVTIALPLIVGLTRIYLGTHWTSDVIAGWALGVFCFCTVLLGFHMLR